MVPQTGVRVTVSRRVIDIPVFTLLVVRLPHGNDEAGLILEDCFLFSLSLNILTCKYQKMYCLSTIAYPHMLNLCE